MCDTPFKTPFPYYRTPKAGGECLFRDKGFSDSDESVTSSNSDNTESGGTGSTNGEISLLAEFDDFMRFHRALRTAGLETNAVFMEFIEQTKQLFVEYFQAVDECRRLQCMIDTKVHECSDLENKLQKARQLMDCERQNTRTARKERDELQAQINIIRDLLFKDKGDSSRLFPDEMRRKLSFLHNNNNIQSDTDSSTQHNVHNQQLSAIKEINSTGSILSDFSYSRSEDDLDSSHMQHGKAWKKHRPSTGGVAEPATKKRRSSGSRAVEIGSADTVRATTTVTVSKGGPITATSVIESVPKTPSRPESTSDGDTCVNAPPSNLVFESWAREVTKSSDRRIHCKEHCLQQKTLVMPENCVICEKRIRFGRTGIKCKECKAICHVECKEKLPLPCIPLVSTPNQRNGLGVIGDYTPTIPPMVPAILIHCINEIELRGLSEVGIYRVPGAERDVKALKERFLKGKGSPCLNDIDIHVICGTVKDFLRNLHEPLVTHGLWKKFMHAIEAKDPADVQPSLYQVISELPQPNRDTMAYMMLHLQKVAESNECKMRIGNLAKVFGPTIVGYSSPDPTPDTLMDDVVRHNNLMEQLLLLPSSYWSSFINIERTTRPSRLQQTPSTDSLLRHLPTKQLFTPVSNKNSVKKRQRYFPSPKNMR